MTERHTFTASDENTAEMLVDLVPEHLLANRAPIQFIVTDELNGPDCITCINLSAAEALRLADVLRDYAAKAATYA